MPLNVVITNVTDVTLIIYTGVIGKTRTLVAFRSC